MQSKKLMTLLKSILNGYFQNILFCLYLYALCKWVGGEPTEAKEGAGHPGARVTNGCNKSQTLPISSKCFQL